MWSFKKNGKQSIGKTKGGWNTKLHLVSADAKIAVNLSLSAGNKNDAPEGRKLLASTENLDPETAILMDKAYEDNETRETIEKLGYVPVVPPKINRKNPWKYDKEMYKKRNVVERLFRKLKEFRRIFTRYDKLDIVFLGFAYLGLSLIMIK